MQTFIFFAKKSQFLRIVLVRGYKTAYHALAEDNLTTALDIRIICYSCSVFYTTEEDNNFTVTVTSASFVTPVSLRYLCPLEHPCLL